MKPISEYDIFVKRLGLTGIVNILVAISSLILLPIITKSFSTIDYGIWVQITTTISLIPNIATLGLPYTMIRFLSAEKDVKKKQEAFYSIVTIVIASSIILCILLYLFSENIASAIFTGNVNIVLLLIVILFFASINLLLINYFQTFLQMKRYSIFLFIQTYLGVLIVSYFAINKPDIFMTSLGLLFAYLITFFIMAYYIIIEIGFIIPKFNNLREYLFFGLSTIPSNLSSWIVNASDRYIIGIILGPVFVGYYTPGYILANVILIILGPFSMLLPPLLSKYYEENNIEQIRTILKYSLKYFLLIAIPTTFGLSILSKPILMILTTQEIALNGYLVTPFIVLSTLLLGINGIINIIFFLEKKPQITGVIWIISAIMNLSFNIILIPYFGIIGAAMVTLMSYLTSFILTLYYSLKFFEFDFDLPFIIKSIISSILISLLIILANPNGILNILTVIIISSVIYFVLMIAFKGITFKEINFFKEFLKF